MFRHVNPTLPDRTARAPYNFVPLPNGILTVEDGIFAGNQRVKPWESHDRYLPETHTGWIDLEIKTLTPLFIRGAVVSGHSVPANRNDARLRPVPFTTPNGLPAIPGSSLRGMARTLVEILSFSKIKPVSKERPFFRTVAPDRIGRAYGERMRQNGGAKGGFLRRHGDDWVIETCEILRVARSQWPQPIHDGNTPQWKYQQKPCWVQHSDGVVSKIEFEDQGTGWSLGTLVLTGNVPGKEREFVFLTSETFATVSVPETVWERFHSDDQMTQWQERAFPRDKPRTGSRRQDGYLRDGEPVFFLADEDLKSEDNPEGLVFLGRAGMFRFPYDKKPADIVPNTVRNAGLDLAEGMFGMVGENQSIKGRVFFEDAVAEEGGPAWLEEVLVPRILSSPKVTTFQHYLTQDGSRGKEQLKTYLEGDGTTIRGHKLYWHRWDAEQALTQIKEIDNHEAKLRSLLRGDESQFKQYTVIQPVRAGVTFAGRIRFENLTDLELGVLIEALSLPVGCAHKIGMGKPLGLGSIRIESRLHIVNRYDRYATWSASGETEEPGSRFRKVFLGAVLNHARATEETMVADNVGLKQIARLDVLYRMLAWDSRPSRAKTEYMNLARFKERPVLPTPHSVLDATEPDWKSDRPTPISEGNIGATRHSIGSGEYGPRSQAREAKPMPTVAIGKQVMSSRSLPPETPVRHKPVQKGQTLSGILRHENDRWTAMFEGDERPATISNPDKVPAGSANGTRAEFFITEQSKRIGINCRFVKMQ